MTKCHRCGRLRAIGRACACGAVMLWSLAFGEPHVETQRYDPPPVVAAVALSSARSTTGNFRFDAKRGRYVLTGYALSTGNKGG